MKIDYNKENINKNKIELLDYQVELVMRSLELYCYIYRFAYPRKKLQSEEEGLRISLVIETYEQIMAQYDYNSKFKNVFTDKIFKELEKRIA